MAIIKYFVDNKISPDGNLGKDLSDVSVKETNSKKNVVHLYKLVS
jgi:hypothetical protein